jgi:glycosyltransferase involved in cell wall biosynthesis
VSERSKGRPNKNGGCDQLPTLVSVVIPAYNEGANIENVAAEVARVLEHSRVALEIIIVDDGSTDETFEEACRLARAHARVKAIRFSRNFGKEAALLAGLRTATGDVVVTMDADLQHPPAIIPDLLERWRQGAKVVHAVKRSRETDPWIVRVRAAAFNLLMARLTGIDIKNSSDFKLLDRVAVDAIIHDLPERRRFYRGLAGWIGYSAASVPFDVCRRESGQAKMSFGRLLGLATVAIVTFTAAPLRIVTLLGVLTLSFGFTLGAATLLSWWQGKAVSGFATIIFTSLILGSFIMISLGIIGEYIAKIYDELKARPSYLVEAMTGSGDLDALPARYDLLPARPSDLSKVEWLAQPGGQSPAAGGPLRQRA